MTATPDVFLAKAREKTEALQREIALLEAQEAGVRRRRLELEKDAADWARAIELYTETVAPDDAEAPRLEGEGRKQTIGEMIASYLSGRPGRTAKVTAIASWLAEIGRFPGGSASAGQNYSMTYNALLRNRNRFEKADKGEWRLIEEPPADES